MESELQNVVVVGAGLAGARICQELRGRGYAGALTLLGAERHLPYDRPPLSKQLMLGETDDTTLDLPWEDLEVDVRLGVTAHALGERTLSTSAGPVPWDALVLATGAVPVRLRGDDGSHVLRSVDDARRLRAALVAAARVVVVGAGWIGAEVATAAARHGCASTVVEAAATPLAAPLGECVGRLTVPWYAEAGIDLRCGVSVARLDGSGVTLADGEHLAADVVVSGIGVRPDLRWLEGSGLELADGVVTDAAGRTNLPGVYAVGDCARRWSPRAGRLVRTEHWDDALHAPEAVATAMLGEQAAYDPVPYFWSEQLGRRLQWVGWREGDPTLWRGEPGDPAGWAAAWLDETGRLRGFLSVDRPRDLLQARRVIDAGARPDPARLADPAVRVRDA